MRPELFFLLAVAAAKSVPKPHAGDAALEERVAEVRRAVDDGVQALRGRVGQDAALPAVAEGRWKELEGALERRFEELRKGGDQEEGQVLWDGFVKNLQATVEEFAGNVAEDAKAPAAAQAISDSFKGTYDAIRAILKKSGAYQEPIRRSRGNTKAWFGQQNKETTSPAPVLADDQQGNDTDLPPQINYGTINVYLNNHSTPYEPGKLGAPTFYPQFGANGFPNPPPVVVVHDQNSGPHLGSHKEGEEPPRFIQVVNIFAAPPQPPQPTADPYQDNRRPYNNPYPQSQPSLEDYPQYPQSQIISNGNRDPNKPLDLVIKIDYDKLSSQPNSEGAVQIGSQAPQQQPIIISNQKQDSLQGSASDGGKLPEGVNIILDLSSLSSPLISGGATRKKSPLVAAISKVQPSDVPAKEEALAPAVVAKPALEAPKATPKKP